MEDQIAKQRAKVDEHFRLENAHEWHGVHATFSAKGQPYFDLVPFETILDGASGIESAYKLLSTALPDVRFEVVAQYDVVGCSIREILLSGTHQGVWCGIPASGRKVRVRVAGFFIFDSAGELVAERVYFNNETITKQMRSE